MASRLLLLLCITLAANIAYAKKPRSSTAIKEFKFQNPCPAAGATKGSCKGYIIDHIVPLCADGADAAANMQWQTVAEAKMKDVEERKMCRL
jgi:hypothetical protein